MTTDVVLRSEFEIGWHSELAELLSWLVRSQSSSDRYLQIVLKFQFGRWFRSGGAIYLERLVVGEFDTFNACYFPDSLRGKDTSNPTPYSDLCSSHFARIDELEAWLRLVTATFRNKLIEGRAMRLSVACRNEHRRTVSELHFRADFGQLRLKSSSGSWSRLLWGAN